MTPLWVLNKRCDKDQQLISGVMCSCPYLWGSLADCSSFPQYEVKGVELEVSAFGPWLLSVYVPSHKFSGHQLPFFFFPFLQATAAQSLQKYLATILETENSLVCET